MIKFGPAGNSNLFYAEGCKTSVEAPVWLYKKGLTAYEYQCGNGINITEEGAGKIGVEAEKYGISVSIHAPYFISLASEDKEKRENAVKYIINTLRIARAMKAKRIVVHPGGCSKRDRREAFEVACDTMQKAVREAKNKGYEDISICPETMGKINQIGTLEEIIEMCSIDKILVPTIDFGHLNARTMGGLNTEESFYEIIKYIVEKLGEERGKFFHSHFSKIEYTKGGEKRHLTFEDNVYGPEFKLLAGALKKTDTTPVIICESAGTTMAEDALKMKEIYDSI